MVRTVSIVLVEDQKMVRDGIVKLFAERDNLEIIGQAENGVQLFKILETKEPDVILLDLEMPEMDGSETLDVLKKVFPQIKTIIVSQYDEEVLIKDLFNRGANAYISKGADWEILEEAIHGVHTKGFYIENIHRLIGDKSQGFKKVPYFRLIYSKREREIIRLVCLGDQTGGISNKLSIAPKTVEANLTEIYRKAQVKNRNDFLIYAMKEGLNYLGTS